jgi:hypothetical protein
VDVVFPLDRHRRCRAAIDSDVRYDETIPGTTSDDKTFSEFSFRAGRRSAPSEKVDFYASYGDGFLPPTPEQLFAFPLSAATRTSRPRTAGVRARCADPRQLGGLEVALFLDRHEGRDRVRPDADHGRSVRTERNAGATRVAASKCRQAVGSRGDVGVSATRPSPTPRSRTVSTTANEVPWSPKSASARGSTPRFRAGRDAADVLYVGAQVLDNDPANARDEASRLHSRQPPRGWERALGGSRGRGDLGSSSRRKNLFDEQYATRGSSRSTSRRARPQNS